MSHAIATDDNVCPCGETDDHQVAQKRTEDGRTVIIWSDGMVTWAMGHRIRGIGRARSRYERRVNLEAAWVVAGIVSLLKADEVPAALTIARRELRADIKGGVGVDRARLERLTLRSLLRIAVCSSCKTPTHPSESDDAGRCESCMRAAGIEPLRPA